MRLLLLVVVAVVEEEAWGVPGRKFRGEEGGIVIELAGED